MKINTNFENQFSPYTLNGIGKTQVARLSGQALILASVFIFDVVLEI